MKHFISFADFIIPPQIVSLASIRRFFLLTLIFSIIIQTGVHFWPPFSFVSGVRIDYLSPTLYFSDIIIIGLFLLELLDRIQKRHLSFFLTIALFVLVFSPYLLISSMPVAHVYGTLLLGKFIFVWYVVSRYFRAWDMASFLKTLAFGVLIVSLLAFAQFFFQSALQGPFYFFGERAIDPRSIGAATFSVAGSEVLRAYGTFPHPNVLAFFLFFSCTFFIFSLHVYRDVVYRVSIILGTIALFLTFSRVIIFLYCGALLYYFFRSRKMLWVIFILAMAILYVVLFVVRFSPESLTRDLSYRIDLLNIGFAMLGDTFLFGGGLLQYFYAQIAYHTRISPIFLQPVHNIYLLVWLQLGILGVTTFFIIILRSLWRVYRQVQLDNIFFDRALFVLLASVVIVGVFDHFLLTLQQGQLMLAVIFGLVWRRR